MTTTYLPHTSTAPGAVKTVAFAVLAIIVAGAAFMFANIALADRPADFAAGAAMAREAAGTSRYAAAKLGVTP